MKRKEGPSISNQKPDSESSSSMFGGESIIPQRSLVDEKDLIGLKIQEKSAENKVDSVSYEEVQNYQL